jgi:glycogen(starch) synthase
VRIAFLTNNQFPPREGIGRHILEVARRLAASGHEPVVVAPGKRPFGAWEEEMAEGLRVRRYPWRPLRPFHQWLAARELRRWLAASADGADILHVHLPLLPPLAAPIHTVVTFHSPLLADTAAISEPGLRARLVRLNARLVSRRYEQAWLERATCITTVSGSVRAQLIRHYDTCGRRIHVIRNGVDATFFASVRRQPEPFALYVGRLGYRKGLPRLLEAFARVPVDLVERLVLAGEGPLRSMLETLAGRLGIARRVQFEGFLDRRALASLLGRAACLVNPADYESGPLTVLEAMAAGTPVVSTATGLVAELGPRPPLLLVERSATDLASKLALVLSDPDAAEARAAAARQLVTRSFDWDRVVRAYGRLYGIEERLAA